MALSLGIAFAVEAQLRKQANKINNQNEISYNGLKLIGVKLID